MRGFRRSGLVCWLVGLCLAVGCGESEPPLRSEPETAVELPAEVQLANRRLEDAVALARVHMQHAELEQAEDALRAALADPIATEKTDAIALLEEIKAVQTESLAAQDFFATAEVSSSTPAPKPAPSPVVPPAQPNEAPKADQPTPRAPSVSRPVATVPERPPVRLPKTPATDDMLTELEETARRSRSATEAHAAYQRFLTRHTLTSEQDERVQPRLEYWGQLASEQKVRVGARWVTADEAAQLRAEADRLIEQAADAIRAGNFVEARKTLEQASRVDQNGIRPDFILGMLNSTVSFNHPPTSEKHFREVLDRSPTHVSALNNLALTEVKLRKFPLAFAHWKQAAESAPKTPEVVQNLGRLLRDAQAKKLEIEVGLLRRFQTLYDELTARGQEGKADPKVGWLYMPLYLPQEERSRNQEGQGAKLVASGSGTGFVVHPGFILTNRHVVEQEDFGTAEVIRIVDPTDPQHLRELEASVVAVSDKADLALLRCDALQAPAVVLKDAEPRRGSDVLILGYPRINVVGRGLKVTRGIITALPEASHDNMLLFDAQADHGNSGGPVCDVQGHVVAVLTIKVLDYSGGVPSRVAIPFVQQHVPQFPGGQSDGPPLTWPDVDANVSPSTVMVLTNYREVPVGLDASKTPSKLNRTYLEDVSCSACNGTSTVSCPAKGCVRGRITVAVQYQENIRIGDRVLPVTKRRSEPRPCPVCNGSGRIKCRHCVGGRDPQL